MHAGHLQIHDRDIGAEPSYRVARFAAVGRLRYDLQPLGGGEIRGVEDAFPDFRSGFSCSASASAISGGLDPGAGGGRRTVAALGDGAV